MTIDAVVMFKKLVHHINIGYVKFAMDFLWSKLGIRPSSKIIVTDKVTKNDISYDVLLQEVKDFELYLLKYRGYSLMS